ncbi:hypothetical protein [Sphingomonas leidyi]|nr:hypothetical protein [Sphingomonas leidyi]
MLLPFIAALMLAITGITSVVHAPEASVTGIELAMTHAPGDADEVPAHGGKDYPHRHSICHGHDLAAPIRALRAPGFDCARRIIYLIASVAECARSGYAAPSSYRLTAADAPFVARLFTSGVPSWTIVSFQTCAYNP